MQLQLLLQTAGFGPVYTEKSSSLSIMLFHSAQGNQSLHLFVYSGFIAALWMSSSKRGNVCSPLLFPASDESKTLWWGKGSLLHCANQEPSVILPVLNHSLPTSSFQAVCSTHTKNPKLIPKHINPIFNSKGLCKLNNSDIVTCVAPTVCLSRI